MNAGGSPIADPASPNAVQAVAGLFDAHADAIFLYAARRVGADLAGDVVGQVFLIALDRYESYTAELGVARGWLFGITNNVLRHHWRSERRLIQALERQRNTQHTMVSGVVDPLLSIDDRLDAPGEVERVMQRVLDLPADDRDLLMMFAWEHLPYADIAEAFGVPVGTVRSRIHALRRRLANRRTTGAES